MRSVDTLFGRLAVLVVVVLLFPHFAWYFLMRVERNELQSRFAVDEMVFLVESVEQHRSTEPGQPLPSRLKLAPANSPEAPAAQTQLDVPLPMKQFMAALSERLPPGTAIRVDRPPHPPRLWVLPPGGTEWFVLPMLRPRPPPSPDRAVLWLVSIFLAAVLLAVFAAWRLQRPLRTLAEAVTRFGRGLPVPPVPERGPREFRQLTRGFNQMVADISQNESDRGIMLAGVGHDLKTPLARLRLRAEMVDEPRQREGFVRDTDSLSHIVDQFLVFAHDGMDRSTIVEVDAHCERYARNFRSGFPGREPIELSLQAGPGFELSTATLDRLLSNLLENAYAYGAPPVSLETWRDGALWHLAVTDSGPGIALNDIETVTRPFVRLDPARGGNAHCGLGLAIVTRLARRMGGDYSVANVSGRGLRVDLMFPVLERSVGEQRVERRGSVAVHRVVSDA